MIVLDVKELNRFNICKGSSNWITLKIYKHEYTPTYYYKENNIIIPIIFLNPQDGAYTK